MSKKIKDLKNDEQMRINDKYGYRLIKDNQIHNSNKNNNIFDYKLKYLGKTNNNIGTSGFSVKYVKKINNIFDPINNEINKKQIKKIKGNRVHLFGPLS